MTGMAWSKEECRYFRNVIMPLSEFSANGRVNGSGLKFGELAIMMQRDMDARGLSRRTYEAGMMYEHYYQRVRPELQRAKAKQSGASRDSKDSREPNEGMIGSDSLTTTHQRSGSAPTELEGDEEQNPLNRSGGLPGTPGSLHHFSSSPPVFKRTSGQFPTKTASKRMSHSEDPAPELFQRATKKERRTIDGQPTGRFSTFSSALTSTTPRQYPGSSGQHVGSRAGGPGPGHSSRVIGNQPLLGYYARNEVDFGASQHLGGYPASYESGGHIDAFQEPRIQVGYNAPNANIFSQAIQRRQSGHDLSANPPHRAAHNDPASPINLSSREIQRAIGTGTTARQSSDGNREMPIPRPASRENSIIKDAAQGRIERPTSTDIAIEAATILTRISSSADTTIQASPTTATTTIEPRVEEVAVDNKGADKEGAPQNKEKSKEDNPSKDEARDDLGEEGKNTTAPAAVCETCKRPF